MQTIAFITLTFDSTGARDGQVLQFNGSSGVWEAGDLNDLTYRGSIDQWSVGDWVVFRANDATGTAFEGCTSNDWTQVAMQSSSGGAALRGGNWNRGDSLPPPKALRSHSWADQGCPF